MTGQKNLETVGKLGSMDSLNNVLLTVRIDRIISFFCVVHYRPYISCDRIKVETSNYQCNNGHRAQCI